jgi:hypothetical protein
LRATRKIVPDQLVAQRGDERVLIRVVTSRPAAAAAVTQNTSRNGAVSKFASTNPLMVSDWSTGEQQ